jgi:hypothetical protein
LIELSPANSRRFDINHINFSLLPYLTPYYMSSQNNSSINTMSADPKIHEHSHMHDSAAGHSEGNGNGGYGYNGAAVARSITPGGHPYDSSQPAFPVYHRKFANPAPLGLLA